MLILISKVYVCRIWPFQIAVIMLTKGWCLNRCPVFIKIIWLLRKDRRTMRWKMKFLVKIVAAAAENEGSSHSSGDMG